MVSNKTLVIGVLARDCVFRLKNNIPLVEELGSMFRDYYVVVYENDSVDGTKECVQQWAKENAHVIAISEQLHQVTIPPKSQQNVKPTKSLWRIQKMAGFRNRILEEVHQRFSPDFFCFIDIDIASFIPSSVVEAIEKAPTDWGLCVRAVICIIQNLMVVFFLLIFSMMLMLFSLRGVRLRKWVKVPSLINGILSLRGVRRS